MSTSFLTLRQQLARQLAHWEIASQELANLENTASPQAWASLEQYVGLSVRNNLSEAVIQLRKEGNVIRAMYEAARSPRDLDEVWRRIVAYRTRYLQTETLVDFFGHAVNTRTNPSLEMNLRAFDVLAMRSIALVLEPLGKKSPPVLTYLDKGLGASILKAGLRLWDGSTSAVATIKVTYHNRRRPTALIHETGHQLAHILDWNLELSNALSQALKNAPTGLASLWSSWSSEIAADAFGFVHTGFAAVAALSDVVGGDAPTVFRYIPGDPHPISYLRVMLGVEMCRRFYGRGPWDELGEAWTERYSPQFASASVRDAVEKSTPLLPKMVELILMQRMRAFNGQSLSQLIDPARVSPTNLQRLETEVGAALFTSPRWIWMECLRLIALTGLSFVTKPEQSKHCAEQQDQFMRRLGETVHSVDVAMSTR